MSDSKIKGPVESATAGSAGRPAGPGEPANPARRQAGSRRRKSLIWIAGILVFLVIAFFVADAILRSYAEGRAAEQITRELPKGVKAPDLKVDITGFTFIGQYVTGSFDNVTLTAKKAMVDGVPIDAEIIARGIPTDLSKPVDTIDGAVVISQDAANQLVKIPASTSAISFGSNSLGYSGKVDVLGLPIAFTTRVSPKADGTTIQLTPTSVKIVGGPAQVDLGGFVSQLLGNKPYPLCVAQFLPAGVKVTDVTVTTGRARIGVSAHHIVLNEKTFGSHGTCA